MSSSCTFYEFHQLFPGIQLLQISGGSQQRLSAVGNVLNIFFWQGHNWAANFTVLLPHMGGGGGFSLTDGRNAPITDSGHLKPRVASSGCGVEGISHWNSLGHSFLLSIDKTV